MKKMKRYLFIFLFALFALTSCSRIDLATNFADTYIKVQLDKYFDINSLQSQFIKKNLKNDILSVKKIIFPRVADELEKVLKETDEIRTYNRDLIIAHEKAMKDIFYDGLKIFEHSAVGFAVQLSPEQLNSFKKEFWHKSEDIMKIANDPSESRKKRFDKSRKYIEDWIGKLTVEQRKDLNNFCQLHLFPYHEQVLNREKLANGFYKIFPDMNKRKQYVSDLFLKYEEMRDAAYTQTVLEDQDRLIDVLVKIGNNMTVEQRNHLKSTLKDRIQQLRDSAAGKKRGWF